jgi:predicted RecB family nuclease
MTLDLLGAKILPALACLDEIDPGKAMEFAVESRVGFGDVLPGVFGSTDFLGRLGDTAVVLDWKFGDGVMVEVEENAQLMFYAAAAMRTEATRWVFDGAKEILCVIVQPPYMRQWRTTPERIAQFERDLVRAVKAAEHDNAALSLGEHCRWCAAKPLCPQMTGAVDRAQVAQLGALDAGMIGRYLANADVLEQWIADLRALAHQMLDYGVSVPGYKLVAKRASRQWRDEGAAVAALSALLPADDLYSRKLITPPQAEKALKALQKELPGELVTAISSGSTLAPDSDPRPAYLQIGQQLRSALSKLQ